MVMWFHQLFRDQHQLSRPPPGCWSGPSDQWKHPDVEECVEGSLQVICLTRVSTNQCPVCVLRSGRAGGWTPLLLPRAPACSAAPLLLLQDQDLLLPQVAFSEREEQEQQVRSPAHLLTDNTHQTEDDRTQDKPLITDQRLKEETNPTSIQIRSRIIILLDFSSLQLFPKSERLVKEEDKQLLVNMFNVKTGDLLQSTAHGNNPAHIE